MAIKKWDIINVIRTKIENPPKIPKNRICERLIKLIPNRIVEHSNDNSNT